MKVGIIVVTYNSQKDIARLLDSVVIQEYKKFTIYVVDNNSDDETINIIKKYRYELDIEIISSKVNNGFAKGNNIGIQRAIDDGCDFVFILNPDMQLEEECIEILVNRISSDEKIGVVGPVILFGHIPGNIIQDYGTKANFKTQKKIDQFSHEKWSKKLPPVLSVDLVLGGAMMIKSNVLKIIGLFEEDYFMYNDELDLAYRVKNAGYKTLSVRDAKVKHFHDFNNQNKKGNNLMYYYVIRNRYLYFKKYGLYINFILSLIKEIMEIPLKILWAIRRMKNIKLLKYYYTGLVDGLRGKKGMSEKSFN